MRGAARAALSLLAPGLILGQTMNITVLKGYITDETDY